MKKKDDEVNPFLGFNYTKYLNCPQCKKVELYCPKHRKEVEEMLFL